MEKVVALQVFSDRYVRQDKTETNANNGEKDMEENRQINSIDAQELAKKRSRHESYHDSNDNFDKYKGGKDNLVTPLEHLLGI